MCAFDYAVPHPREDAFNDSRCTLQIARSGNKFRMLPLKSHNSEVENSFCKIWQAVSLDK